jgi:hypothetical protein
MSGVSNNWKVFSSHCDRIQIRYIHVDKTRPVLNETFKREDYPTNAEFRVAIERSVVHHNNNGYNVYQPVHIVNDDFNGSAVGNGDIFALDKIFLDLDRDGKNKEPASKAELVQVWNVKVEIEKFLNSLGWPKPHVVMSGNGYHLYYFLDDRDSFLDPSDEHTELIRDALHLLGDKFDTPQVKIDPCVHNAGRITKFIGTVARKGKASEERPYRVVELIENPPTPFEYVSKCMLQDLIQKYSVTPHKNSLQPSKVEASANSQQAVETPREVAVLKDKLRYIDPSCDRSIWVKIVYSILSTCWNKAESIALEWSQKSPDKFVLADFQTLVKDFKEGKAGYGKKAISLGTVHYYAVEGGWE